MVRKIVPVLVILIGLLFSGYAANSQDSRYPIWPDTSRLQPASMSIRQIIATMETEEKLAKAPQYGSVLTDSCEHTTFTIKEVSTSYLYPAVTTLNPDSKVVRTFQANETFVSAGAYVRSDGIWLDIWDSSQNATFIQLSHIKEALPQCFLDNAG